MKKAQDCIVRMQIPNKPDADMKACGYRFVCSHISVDALMEQDVELDIESNELVAVEQDNGVNFYVKR